MHVHAYLAAAATILHAYKGTVPFATWLKNYFREHKKFGSRDRKMVSQLAFVFFRLGKAFDHLALEDKILTAVFLMANEPQALLEEMRPEWNTLVHLSPEEKLVRLHAAAEWKEMFPFPEKLTKVIDSKPFVLSHLVQPQLFLRLRPGKEEGARQKLASAGLSFKQEGPQCIALPNSTKATDVLVIDQEAVVQDFSSQQVLDLLPDVLFQKPITVWDCCAASGGKSLLLFDKHPNVKLTVSDVRESILVNLKKRFAAAGIRQPQSFIADLAAKNFRPPVSNFQLIICDAPCSGSGTWGRTLNNWCSLRPINLNTTVHCKRR